MNLIIKPNNARLAILKVTIKSAKDVRYLIAQNVYLNISVKFARKDVIFIYKVQDALVNDINYDNDIF